jgi:SPP1 family predicted phage head-tail adaptor
MKAPNLNRKLVLESPEDTADGAGGFVQGWVTRGTLWAAVVARSGGESAQEGVPLSSQTYRITVRGVPVGSSMRPAADQRFRDGARIFVIRAVAEADAQGRFLTCVAQEEILA